jgi:hypothetical protein
LAEDRKNNGREPNNDPEGLSGLQVRADRATKRVEYFLARTSATIAFGKFPDFLEPRRKTVLLLLARVSLLHSLTDDCRDEFMRRKEMGFESQVAVRVADSSPVCEAMRVR